jgi:hypothetical protein
MVMSDERLDAEIMKLDLDARARRAEKLVLSLDVPSDNENLYLLVVEAKRRLRDLYGGGTNEIPAEEIFLRARQTIS